MKKRLVLGLLLVAMVCALFTVTSLAADAHDHTSHDGWTELKAGVATLTSGGKYYLTGDLTLTGQMTVSGATICLNGHTLTAAAGTRPFYNAKNTTFTLCDCTETVTQGYIDPTTKLWTKGETVPTGGVDYDLKGGIVTGGNRDYGAVGYMEGNVILDGVNLAGNKCTGGGGGTFYMTTTSTLTVKNSKIVGNTSTVQGGGVSISGVATFSENSVVAYNTTTTVADTATGGGLFVGTTSTLTVSDCSIDHNSSAYRGGGIGGYGKVTVNAGTVISDNIATPTSGDYRGGGGLYVTGTTTINGGEIKNNTANCTGGGGIRNGGTLIINGGKITGNTAMGAGGGIYTTGTTTINGGEISGNKTPKTGVGGTGIYAGAAVTMNGGTIKENTVLASGTSWSGGAVFVPSTGTFTLNGGSITGNYGANYGGVYVQGKFIMNGGEISGNTGVYAGAIGVYGIAGGAVTINGGVIKNNTNTGSGAQVLNIVGGAAIPVTINGGVIGGTMNLTSTLLTYTITSGLFKTNDLSAPYNVSAKVNTAKSAYDTATGFVGLLPEYRAAEAYMDGTLFATYETLSAALTANAGTGNVVKMVKDYANETSTDYVFTNSAKAVILDMNGHSIKQTAGKGIGYSSYYDVLKIYSSAEEPGVIHTNGLSVNSCGGLELKNLVLYSNDAQCVNFDCCNASFNAINRIEDCVIGNGNWYTLVVGYAATPVGQITLKNTTIIQNGIGTKSNVAIGGRQAGKLLKLEENVSLYSKAANPTVNMTLTGDSKQLVKSDFTGLTATIEEVGITATGLNRWTIPVEASTIEALTAAVNNPRVANITLTGDITDTDAKITLGQRTLDLKGNTLSVNSMIADSGELKDSTSLNGKLVVGTTAGKANATFRDGNKQLVFGDANGFWFSEVKEQIKFEQKNENEATYAFNIYLKNPNAEAYAKAHPETVTVGVTVSCKVSETQRFSKAFTVKDVRGLEANVHPVAYLLNNPNHGVKVNMKGFADFSAIWANSWILTNTTSQMGGYAQINPAS